MKIILLVNLNLLWSINYYIDKKINHSHNKNSDYYI